MAITVKKENLEDIEFFGGVDKVHDKVGSEYPAWYNDAHKQELADRITADEMMLAQGGIPEKDKPGKLAELKKNKKRLDEINGSMPEISDGQKDALANMARELGKGIKDSMFSYSEMQSGDADAATEYQRQTTPCVKLSDAGLAVAHKLGCRISSDGEVSRNDAARVWKICQRRLGANSDIESLRRR